ncbi:MAG: response regulator [FCB group bacterium]|jgi:DNA-binding response OmpR family regulator|nr:response regulator [FCB group bacterium]
MYPSGVRIRAAVKDLPVEAEAAQSTQAIVLIVEDDAVQRMFLERLLKQQGYVCEGASSCAEGRLIFRPAHFALCLIDLGLPDGSGLSLITEFAQQDSCLVPLVLTGDGSPDTIIGTMRASAFDYLTKPIDRTTLMAAVSRGHAHHVARRERAEYLQLLLEEKAQLQARVEAATADIRQYATACETSNGRLRTLLSLTQLSVACVSDQMLMETTFREVSKHVPLQCLSLCDVSRQRLLATHPGEGNLKYVLQDSGSVPLGFDSLLMDVEPREMVQRWVERATGLDTLQYRVFVYPQFLWNRSVCTVAFHLEDSFDTGPAEEEFLSMCAHFLAFEWEQANLLLRVAHHATLGSIALEMSRNYIQPLTALRTAADFVSETVLAPEAQEGMQVIRENVERLRRQMQEFRKLSLLREDCVETVRLDDFVDQALDILTVAIQNRGVTVEKLYETDCECVLLNGTLLARTFLDLILGALRSAELGGKVSLSLREAGPGHVAFEVSHNGNLPGGGGRNAPLTEQFQTHPGLQLAERTVHTCGGTLNVSVDRGHRHRVRVVLPRNATNPAPAKESLA